MKYSLFIFCLLLIFNLKSQDTIYFKNSNIKSVKVLEVSSNTIKYKFHNDSSSPIFISETNEIKRIKYFNGWVDSFHVAKPITINYHQEKENAVIKYKYEYTNEKIVVENNDLFYSGDKLKDKELYYLINNYPKPETKLLLNKEFENMRSNHRKQYIFGFMGLGAGIIAPLQGSILTLGTDDENFFFVGVASGLTLGITGLIISSINKKYYQKRRLKIANAYNIKP